MIELERRFRLNLEPFVRTLTSPSRDGIKMITPLNIKQWYLTTRGVKPTLRVRETRTDDHVIFEQTLKGPKNDKGCTEIEFEISPTHAREMIGLAVYPVIEKTRYVIQGFPLVLEVDLYISSALATDHCVEIECPPGVEPDEWEDELDEWLASPSRPAWLGEEITDTGPSNRKLASQLGEACRIHGVKWWLNPEASPVLPSPSKAKIKPKKKVPHSRDDDDEDEESY